MSSYRSRITQKIYPLPLQERFSTFPDTKFKFNEYNHKKNQRKELFSVGNVGCQKYYIQSQCFSFNRLLETEEKNSWRAYVTHRNDKSGYGKFIYITSQMYIQHIPVQYRQEVGRSVENLLSNRRESAGGFHNRLKRCQ